MLMRWGLLDSFRMGNGIRKTMLWLEEAWNFQSHPPSSREGRGAGYWVNNRSCIWDKASIKESLNYGVWRASGLLNKSVCQEGCIHQFYRDRSSWTQDSSTLCLLYFFICLFICILYHILCNKLVSVSKCSLKFWEPLYQIPEPLDWGVETPNL